ncbi:MAG: histidine--tRNA ligase [Planctomycetota bacterium]|nr:MAG: histidine--tRNA ligase [Planctomycetota bacterium]
MIQPRTLKGFRDFLPKQALPREELIAAAREVFRSFGFVPIDLPSLELAEILLGKGGGDTEKELYRFQDRGKRDVAMRFDLTVPFARFAAQHIGQLGKPFKRYHMGTVWRGENVQRGRYREFMQCDFDTIGTRSLYSDIEIGLVIDALLRRLGVERFEIRINHRQVLAGLLETLGLEEKTAEMLRALDKLGKIGREKVAAEMAETAGASEAQSKAVLDFAGLSGQGSELLAKAELAVQGSERGREGIAQLREILAGLAAGGLEAPRLVLDLSIARGLDYYTGTIYESFLSDLPGLGSVCSGGRYDDLASLYSKEELPGIGASLGLDRLLAGLEELGLLQKSGSTAPVFVPFFAKEQGEQYIALVQQLRRAGIGCEFYPEPKRLGQQLKYADKRGFRLAVLVGDDEWASESFQLKDLKTGESEEHALRDLCTVIQQKLEGAA